MVLAAQERHETCPDRGETSSVSTCPSFGWGPASGCKDTSKAKLADKHRERGILVHRGAEDSSTYSLA